MSSITAAIVALILGGAVASATVVGLVSAQTDPSGPSPATVSEPVIEYGD